MMPLAAPILANRTNGLVITSIGTVGVSCDCIILLLIREDHLGGQLQLVPVRQRMLRGATNYQAYSQPSDTKCVLKWLRNTVKFLPRDWDTKSIEVVLHT